jgi:hypothetical protein
MVGRSGGARLGGPKLGSAWCPIAQPDVGECLDHDATIESEGYGAAALRAPSGTRPRGSIVVHCSCHEPPWISMRSWSGSSGNGWEVQLTGSRSWRRTMDLDAELKQRAYPLNKLHDFWLMAAVAAVVAMRRDQALLVVVRPTTTTVPVIRGSARQLAGGCR